MTVPVLPNVSQLLNLTPHDVTLLPDDHPPITISPGGPAARVVLTRRDLGTIDIDGAQIRIGESSTNGRILDLPEAEPDQLIIVARLVAEHAPERNDLVFPDDLERASDGTIVGCRRLSRLWFDPENS